AVVNSGTKVRKSGGLKTGALNRLLLRLNQKARRAVKSGKIEAHIVSPLVSLIFELDRTRRWNAFINASAFSGMTRAASNRRPSRNVARGGFAGNCGSETPATCKRRHAAFTASSTRPAPSSLIIRGKFA